MKNKILITGGVHGDEPTGIKVAGFFENGRSGTSGLICNLDAIKISKRYVETDLNRSFSANEPISLEEKRARKISDIVKKFDLIIDIHNTKALGTTCAIVISGPNNLQVQLAKYFSFNKIVVMPPSGSLISVKPESSISLEIALDSIKIFSSKRLISKILRLKNIKKTDHFNLEIYVFVNKVLSSTLIKSGLDKDDFLNFKKLNRLQVDNLGLGDGRYYPIFLKKEYEEVAFTLVKRIDVK